jgi:PAS domain S-box-containing protein
MKKPARKRTLAGSWLNTSTTPVLMLDARRRVVFFNFGFEQLTGWPADDVTGRVCELAVEDSEDDEITRLTCSLCPPLETLDGSHCSIPTWLTTKDGKAVSRLMNYFPIMDSDGQTEYVIGLASPLPAPATTITTPAQKLHAELAALRSNLRQRFGISSVVAQSQVMRRVLKQTLLAKQTADSILIVGSAGSGREHIARIIHSESELRNRAFIPIDCAAVEAIDIRLTLKRMLIREPDDNRPAHLSAGTIFFANAEHIPRDVQELVVEIAATIDQPVRLVVGTSTDPQQLKDTDTWRDDFLFLSSTINISLPRLADRREDLLPLAQLFLEERNRGSERQIGGFSSEVQTQFYEYGWPGNLDELRDVVTQARTSCDGNLITPEHLPFRFRTGVDAQTVGPEISLTGRPLEQLLAEFEAEHVRQALQLTRNNKSKAAELLGLKRASLLRRIKTLGIDA